MQRKNSRDYSQSIRLNKIPNIDTLQMDLYLILSFLFWGGGMVGHMYGVTLNTKIRGNFEHQNNTINSLKKS